MRSTCVVTACHQHNLCEGAPTAACRAVDCRAAPDDDRTAVDSARRRCPDWLPSDGEWACGRRGAEMARDSIVYEGSDGRLDQDVGGSAAGRRMGGCSPMTRRAVWVGCLESGDRTGQEVGLWGRLLARKPGPAWLGRLTLCGDFDGRWADWRRQGAVLMPGARSALCEPVTGGGLIRPQIRIWHRGCL